MPMPLCRRAARAIIALLLTTLLGVGTGVGCLVLMRPGRTAKTQTLFQGVSYRREARSSPRPLVLHVVEVALRTPGVRLLVTPEQPTGGRELAAQTTSAFLQRNHLQLAVNGGYFDPFRPGFLDYYPRSGDPVDVMGLSISHGQRYSKRQGAMPALCVGSRGAQIRRGDCPTGTEEALAGAPLLVERGKARLQERTAPEPRTVVGLDAEGSRLYLLVLDGRQPRYSEGATLEELAELAEELGMWQALNLDGGGSTTMVREGWLWPVLLNSPIHTRVPGRERPVANHLGIFARPVGDEG